MSEPVNFVVEHYDNEELAEANEQLAMMVAKLHIENDKLREQLADMPKCEECEAMLDCDECLRADADHKARKALAYENAKLRELVRDMHRAICGLVVLGDDYAGEYEDRLCALDDRMRELGVDA